MTGRASRRPVSARGLCLSCHRYTASRFAGSAAGYWVRGGMGDRRRAVEDLYPPGALDAVTWTSDIERDDQRRQITIIMSRTLLGASGHPSEDAALARDTKGRNYVEAVVDQEDPPATVRPTPPRPWLTTS